MRFLFSESVISFLSLLLKLAAGNTDRKKENSHRNPSAGAGWARSSEYTHTHTPRAHVAGLPTQTHTAPLPGRRAGAQEPDIPDSNPASCKGIGHSRPAVPQLYSKEDYLECPLPPTLLPGSVSPGADPHRLRQQTSTCRPLAEVDQWESPAADEGQTGGSRGSHPPALAHQG